MRVAQLSSLFSICRATAAFVMTDDLKRAHIDLLSAVSADAALNDLQHQAFVLVGTSVLARFAFETCFYRARETHAPMPTVPPPACQLNLFGAGGTGNTEIVIFICVCVLVFVFVLCIFKIFFLKLIFSFAFFFLQASLVSFIACTHCS